MSPATLSKNRKPTEVYLAVKKKIVAIGKPQLSGICNFLGISIDPHDDAEKLAEKFIHSCNLDTLVPRRVPERLRSIHCSCIRRSEISGASVLWFIPAYRSKSKAINAVAYSLLQSPEHLKEVFYSHLWESKRTHTDFTTSEAAADFVSQ